MKVIGGGGFEIAPIPPPPPPTHLIVSNHKQGKNILQNLLAVKRREPKHVQV